jgi:hypothetical protein
MFFAPSVMTPTQPIAPRRRARSVTVIESEWF